MEPGAQADNVPERTRAHELEVAVLQGIQGCCRSGRAFRDTLPQDYGIDGTVDSSRTAMPPDRVFNAAS